MAIRFITKEALSDMVDAGEDVQVLNVLPPAQYARGLIAGSYTIPLHELAERHEELDREQPVVVYGADAGSLAPRQAAEWLSNAGFNTLVYEGGIEEWKSAGLPLERTIEMLDEDELEAAEFPQSTSDGVRGPLAR